MDNDRIKPEDVLRHFKYLYEVRQRPVTPLYVIISMGKLTRAPDIEYILNQFARDGIVKQVYIGTARVVAYEPA